MSDLLREFSTAPGESRVFLSGPVGEKWGEAYLQFDLICLGLLARYPGIEVVSPAAIGRAVKIVAQQDGPPSPVREDYTLACLSALLESTHIAMTPGWTRSRGARSELQFASESGIPVLLCLPEGGGWALVHADDHQM